MTLLLALPTPNCARGRVVVGSWLSARLTSPVPESEALESICSPCYGGSLGAEQGRSTLEGTTNLSEAFLCFGSSSGAVEGQRGHPKAVPRGFCLSFPKLMEISLVGHGAGKEECESNQQALN